MLRPSRPPTCKSLLLLLLRQQPPCRTARAHTFTAPSAATAASGNRWAVTAAAATAPPRAPAMAAAAEPSSSAAAALAGADPEQARLMAEHVILVTPDDCVVGPCSKAAAHLVETGLPLHRAFSVFLFDSQNRMLLQQRAHTKITFPAHWANACCSHPLHNAYELGAVDAAVSDPSGTGTASHNHHHGLAGDGAEQGQGAPIGANGAAPAIFTAQYNFEQHPPQPNGGPPNPVSASASSAPGTSTPAHHDPVLGAKRAALRKLTHELGIRPGDIVLEDLHFMNRIHYRSLCTGNIWGEHELDYVLFCRKDVDLSPEKNEVHGVRYVTESELRDIFRASDDTTSHNRPKVSPWFRYIVDKYGWTWWTQLVYSGPGSVLALADDPNGNIHRFDNVTLANWRFHPTTQYPS
jgi:isopentenyldiphosphate isomerase